jgi:hypothetical protein
LLDVLQDAGHRGAHLGIVISPTLGVFAAFEVTNHDNNTPIDLVE